MSIQQKFFNANLISNIGSAFTFIISTFLIVKITGSAFKGALIFLLSIISQIIGSTWAGKYIDQHHAKNSLLYFDLIRAFVIFLLFIPLYFPKLYFLVFLIFLINKIFLVYYDLARKKAFKLLYKSQQIKDINNKINLGGIIGSIIGFFSAGFVVKFSGYKIAFILDPITFLISFFIILKIEMPKTEIKTIPEIYDKKIVFKTLFDNNILKNITIARLINNIASYIFNTLLIFYVVNILKSNSMGYGILEMSKYIGLLIGFFIIHKTMNSVNNYMFAIFLQGISFLMFYFIKDIYFACFAYFLAGICMHMILVSLDTIYINNSNNNNVASINALSMFITRYAGIVSMLIVFIICEYKFINPLDLFIISGIISLIASLYLFVYSLRNTWIISKEIS